MSKQGVKMRGQTRRRGTTGAAAIAALLLLAAGCGSTEPKAASAEPTISTPPEIDLADGPWLLRFNAEAGGEGALLRAVYITITPSTGATTVRGLPALSDPDTYSDASAVLVSGDQTLALLDARVQRADARKGLVRVYSTTAELDRTVDVRQLTGEPDLVPVGAAFDPGKPQLLRVVDNARRVWELDLVAGTGTRDGDLPSRSGWIFANGFDKNSGVPYIEDPASESTLPEGNGLGDIRPVARRGGQVRIDDGTEYPEEPPLPCGFAGAFVTEGGTVWLFCADTARITTYRLAEGAGAWEKVGKESGPIVPGSAAELPVVLPPV